MSLIVMTVFLPKTKEIKEPLKVSKIPTKISHAKWLTILSSFTRFWPAKKKWPLNWKAHFFKRQCACSIILTGLTRQNRRIGPRMYLTIPSNSFVYLQVIQLDPWCRAVHIWAGCSLYWKRCSFERNYGETFHRNCYYRGKGIGFPFYQYWVFVCQMNYSHQNVFSSSSAG